MMLLVPRLLLSFWRFVVINEIIFSYTIKCELKSVNTELLLLKYFDEESPFMNPNRPYEPPKPKVKEKDENNKVNEGENEEIPPE